MVETKMKEPLRKWVREHEIKDEMLWKDSAYEQITFIENKIAGIIIGERDKVEVIGEHGSKSIILPVYYLKRDNLEVILRNNFYDWKMSVISDRPIEVDFDGLFHTTPPIEPSYTGNPLSSVYFQGFPEHLVFGYYAESDKKKWSAEISGNYLLWTVSFLIMRSLGYIKPFKWHTQESHRKELEIEREKRQERINKEK